MFNGRVLRRMCGGIKVNENWIKRYIKQLKQLFGNSNILPFLRISWLNWIGHVNKIDSERKVIQVLNSDPPESPLRGRPKYRWWSCVQTDINKCKITNRK